MNINNKKGIALPIIIVSVLAVLGLSGAGFYLYKSNSKVNTKIILDEISEEQKEAYEKALENPSTIEKYADYVESKGEPKSGDFEPEPLEGGGLDSVEEGREELKTRANKLMEKNLCEVEKEDIESALQMASLAIPLGMDPLRKDLWDWARDAYRRYVANAYICNGPDIYEFDSDFPDVPKHEDIPKVRESIKILEGRGRLAAESVTMGFDDIHNQILSGEFIDQECFTLWDINASYVYRYDDGYGYVQNWDANATFEDIPIYWWYKGLGLGFVTAENEVLANVTHQEFTYPDEDTRLVPGKISGDMHWHFKVMDLNNPNNFWQSKVKIKTYPLVSRYAISVLFEDYNAIGTPGQDLMGWEVYEDENSTFEIPLYKFYCGEEMSFTKSTSEDYGKGTLRVTLTPSKTVTYDELKTMLGE